MSLETNFLVHEGITVPYAPIFDSIRRNHGFFDTRKRPDLAAAVAEGTESGALRDLLVDVASHERYFSLGCDLGQHEELEAPISQRAVAGGYIQLSAFRYELQETANYDRFCKALEFELRPLSKGQHWRIEFWGTYVAFKLPAEEQVTKPSIWIWFFAARRTQAKARASREELLKALSVCLNQTSVLMCLEI